MGGATFLNGSGVEITSDFGDVRYGEDMDGHRVLLDND